LKLDVPNETTAAAIEEGRRIALDSNVKGYTSMDELKAALDV
jgi:DNA-damage-inducible protein J